MKVRFGIVLVRRGSQNEEIGHRSGGSGAGGTLGTARTFTLHQSQPALLQAGDYGSVAVAAREGGVVEDVVPHAPIGPRAPSQTPVSTEGEASTEIIHRELPPTAALGLALDDCPHRRRLLAAVPADLRVVGALGHRVVRLRTGGVAGERTGDDTQDRGRQAAPEGGILLQHVLLRLSLAHRLVPLIMVGILGLTRLFLAKVLKDFLSGMCLSSTSDPKDGSRQLSLKE